MITPHEHRSELGEALGCGDLYLKREDLHPYGSHKGRSIPLMIDRYHKAGDRRFAISSSGNAALAAAHYVKELGARRQEQGAGSKEQGGARENDIELDVFVGAHITPAKLTKLKALGDGEHIRILSKERPLQALAQAISDGYRSLRQSTDDSALLGYEPLAQEIAEIPRVGALFMGSSSGTTAQALAAHFIDEKLPIQVHIVQTSSCHPMSEALTPYDGPDEKSIADAIVDQTAFRKPALIPLIEKTGGQGWFATNDDIRSAQKLVLEHTGLSISTNSALSVVGAMQAAYQGLDIPGAVVCMICGD